MKVTISNKTWIIFSIYRPPDYANLLAFFKGLGKYLNQACENYDNFIVMRDFNIDIRKTSPESHKLDEFCSLFSLTIIIKSNTCFTKLHSSIIDLFLTNKPNFFQKTSAISYVLFKNLVSKGLNQRLFATETAKNLVGLIF